MELNKQIKMKTAIIESFVPPEEVDNVEKRAHWSEEKETWILSKDHIKAG